MKELIITGNIGRDAELKQIGNNNYYTFPVAVEGRGKEGATDWVEVCLYAREGSRQGAVLKKGAGIAARGRNAIRAFVTREGQARAAETLWADQVEVTKFVNDDEGPGANEPEDDGDLLPQFAAKKPAAAPAKAAAIQESENDLPF